jgi:hypothetical protein
MLCVALLASVFFLAAPVFVAPSLLTSAGPSMQSEKESRTPAQRKIDSQLLYEIYRLRGEAKQKQVPEEPTLLVRFDAKRRALVDVRADVTPVLEKKLGKLGATIVSTSREYRSIIAWVPLLALERLADDRTVIAIQPAAQAKTAK